jgi:hypothetical protein
MNDNMNNMNNMNNYNINDIDKNNNKKKADIINKLDLLPNQIVYTYNKINPNFCPCSELVPPYKLIDNSLFLY